MLERIVRDLRYSFRMLAKSPVFTIAAVATLALGIGLNAATFSAVSGILMRPLAGTESPDKLVQIYREWPGIEFGSNSIPHYRDLRDRTDAVFENVAAWNFLELSMASEGRSERLVGILVSANFFQTYGVQGMLGRPFIPGEESEEGGGRAVAVLGHSFWQSRFAADPDVIGRTVNFNGHPFVVVGVAPPNFRGPVNFADVPIYLPIMSRQVMFPGLEESRSNNSMNVIARLRDGETVERASQVLDGVLLQLTEEFPANYEGQLGNVLVLQSEAGIHPSFRTAQLGMSAVLMVVVGLLLLVACVNVANLFLVRARERRREMGIRVSLGARGGTIVQQLLTESLVFSMLSGLAGLGLARVATGLLAGIRPPMDGPWAFHVEMDNSVLFFTLGVSVIAGVLFGLAPALQAARPDTATAVKGGAEDRPGRSRVSSGLVVVQMALSLLLLIISGLFLRSLQGATEIDPGFDEPGTLVLSSVDPELQGYDEARQRNFLDRLAEDVAGLPEITAAALTTTVPLGLSGSDRGVRIPGYEFSEGERSSFHYAMITEGYFDVMGVRLREGRAFRRQDDQSGSPVIIINQQFADRFWPGESALGKIVSSAGQDREVVGVVETGKYRSLGEVPTEFMWFPLREQFRSAVAVVARSRSTPAVALRRIRETVQALDSDMPVYDVRTMEDHMGIALMPARLGGSVLGLFGVLGLILAAVGIYGVMAYSVAQRTREIGIRVALGADRRKVLTLVLGEGLRLALIGAALGLVGAVAAARLVGGLLYNVSALDPAAFIGIPLVLLSVSALAVYVPARRAANMDPIRALKTD